jgi:hypothetical protein
LIETGTSTATAKPIEQHIAEPCVWASAWFGYAPMALECVGFPSIVYSHSFSTPMITPDTLAMKLA